MLTFPLSLSYWIAYAVKKSVAPSTTQWRIPVGLQLFPGAVLIFGLFFLKESPRWLAKNGRHDDALASLAHTRCTTIDDPEVLQELAEIRASVEEEFLATEGLTWKECLKPGIRNRFAIALGIMFWQQFSGTNSIGYYAPQIFESIGIASANASLFATGVYGTVKVVATGIFLLVGIEKLGRKIPLLAGSIWMMTMMIIIGEDCISPWQHDNTNVQTQVVCS